MCSKPSRTQQDKILHLTGAIHITWNKKNLVNPTTDTLTLPNFPFALTPPLIMFAHFQFKNHKYLSATGNFYPGGVVLVKLTWPRKTCYYKHFRDWHGRSINSNECEKWFGEGGCRWTVSFVNALRRWQKYRRFRKSPWWMADVRKDKRLSCMKKYFSQHNINTYLVCVEHELGSLLHVAIIYVRKFSIQKWKLNIRRFSIKKHSQLL